MTPIEIGALLVSGQVQDPETVDSLARHARTFGEIHASMSPLLGQQLAGLWGDPEPREEFRFLSPNRDADAGGVDPIDDLPYVNDFRQLEQDIEYLEHVENPLEQQEWMSERRNTEVAEEVGDLDVESAEPPDPDANMRSMFRKLSSEIDEPITVGDEAVYEDGDRHPLDGDDADEKGDDSPADADDDADDGEG